MSRNQHIGMSGNSRWTDRQVLDMLHRHYVDGVPKSEIAERYGVGKGAVIGVTNRVLKESDEIECFCTKPENKDGGMPAGWWR